MATGGQLLVGSSGTLGVEYLLGTINVSFSSYVPPIFPTTALMGAEPDYGTVFISTKKYSWLQDGIPTGSVAGSNSSVAYGAKSTSLLYVNPSQGINAMSFTYTPNPVPEPGTISLLAGGLITLCVAYRRRTARRTRLQLPAANCRAGHRRDSPTRLPPEAKSR
jgi:hypothetical protein